MNTPKLKLKKKKLRRTFSTLFDSITTPTYVAMWLRFSARMKSHQEGKKHILKMQNSNFEFGKKKRILFAKNFTLKYHVLGMKFKTSFSKRVFNKKQDKKMIYQTNPSRHLLHVLILMKIILVLLCQNIRLSCFIGANHLFTFISKRL